MTPLRKVAALLGAGALLFLVMGFLPESFRWPVLGVGLALAAGGVGVGIAALVRGVRPLTGVEARLRRLEATVGDLAGTVGRQAPVVRRVDDRTRALLQERAAQERASGQAETRTVAVIREVAAGQAWCAALAPGERALVVVPRDVDPAVATRLLAELTSATVEVVPEGRLTTGSGSDRSGS